MAEQGIMALGPRPMDQGPQQALDNEISYSEAYGATKGAVRQAYPDIADQYEQGIQEVLAELGELTSEELEAFIQLIDYIEKNRDRYPEVIAELIEMDIIDEGDFPPEYDDEFMAVVRAAVEEAALQGRAVELPMGAPQGFADGGIATMADMVRREGRFGDTMLAHITPEEAQMLQAAGGSGTINPVTGLPEFFIGKVFKAIGRAVRGVVRGVKKVLQSPIGRIVGTIALTPFVGPVAAGAIVGGITGGIKGAVLGGIGGYINSSGFIENALGSTIGRGLVGAVGETGARLALQTATGTAMGLAGGAKLSDAIKGGVANAAINFALTRAVPKGQEAPIEDRSTIAETAMGGPSAAQTFPLTTTSAPMGSPLGVPPTAQSVASVTPTSVMGQTFTPSANIIQSGGLPVAGNAFGPQYGTTIASPTSVAPSVSAPYQPPSTSLPIAKDAFGPQYGTTVASPTSIASRVSAPYQPPSAGTPAGGGAGDMGIDRLFSEPLAYAKDVYSKYLSPSREGLPADAGIIQKYGPLTAAGLGAMYLGGGFESRPAQMPGLFPEEQGFDVLRRSPNLFYTQNLPGVRYDARGRIIGSSPYTVSGGNPLVPTQGTSYVPRYNQGGIANLGKFPRMNGQIDGPGTEKSDSIPAMLSDGEFVMTARAVRGMGNGSRREGAKKMYKLMAALEKNASRSA